MLTRPSTAYLYVVARDFGFAPNPFPGYFTLATCKPDIRRVAKVADWVVGMGGSRLNATGRCLFAMQVTETATFDEYWADLRFRSKRPIRNGSRKSMVGDNIYRRAADGVTWLQEDSHHSRPDGAPDDYNVRADTRTDRVLISERFVYLGREAAVVPVDVLQALGYSNRRGHRSIDAENARPLFDWLHASFASKFNRVMGDPFDFDASGARYSYKSDRVIA